MGTSTTAEGVTAIGPTVFRDSLSESQAIPPTVAKVQAKWHAKTVAIIYGDDNAFTKTDGDLFKREFEKTGATVVDTETFHIGDKDFGASLTKIAAKKPAVIAIGGLFPEATQIIAQAGKLGIKAHMLGGNGLNSTQMYQVAGPATQGVVVGAAWFIGGKYTGNLEFVKRFKAKYGNNPDQFAAQAYAAAQVVASLAKTARRRRTKCSRACAVCAWCKPSSARSPSIKTATSERRRLSCKSSRAASLICSDALSG